MSLLYIPDIRQSVLESCEELIRKYQFSVRVRDINKVELLSEKCGISIAAAISPIGEREIEIDFYDPLAKEKKNFNDILLLYLDTRAEPKDIVRNCNAEVESFDETVRRSLKCFAEHTLKYRTDILEGDFESWLRKE